MTFRYYVEAYTRDGQQVLGNLDGQAALRTPREVEVYKMTLYLGRGRPKWPRISYWRIVDANGNELSKVSNPYG